MRIKICDSAPNGACSFYRSFGPLSKLSRIDSSISIELMKSVAWYTLADTDILFIARPQDKIYLDSIKMAKEFNVPVWIDYDDNLFNVPEYNPAYDYCSKKESQDIVKGCIEFADIVTVATNAIKETLLPLNDNIVVIENSLNDYNFPLEKVENKSKKICWRGSNTHNKDLLSCSDGMFSLAKKYDKEWVWIFIGGKTKSDLWYVTDHIEKNFNLTETDIIAYHNYIKKLKASIQIVPLLVNNFNLSKSNCSWLEATFSGSVAVAPLGLPEFDKPGIVNYNPGNKDSFGYQMERLMKDKKLRAKNYKKSFDYISENLLLSNINKKRIEVIETLRR